MLFKFRSIDYNIDYNIDCHKSMRSFDSLHNYNVML
jgi:hypothetical protein